MNILFITSTYIGDTILTTGVLAHFAARYPEARITVACGPKPAALFEGAPQVERVIVLHRRKWHAHWFYLWRLCIFKPWGLVLDRRGSAISFVLFARRRRIYFSRGGGKCHRVQSLVKPFHLPGPPSPCLWTNDRHESDAARLVPEGGPVLALGPVASLIGKTWAAENFAALALRLTAPDGILPGARIAVSAAAHERDLVRPIIEAVPGDRFIDLIGRGNLATDGACLRRCDLFIGNDSGLMHMAAAAGIPTLGLFGPTPDDVYAPWGPRAAVVRTTISYEDFRRAGPDLAIATSSLMGSLTVDAAEAAARALWERCQGTAP